MFYEGFMPHKILSHRLMGKSSLTGVMVELKLKWKKRPNEKKRHKATCYTNAQIKLLAPELLAEYYKELFVKDLATKKTVANEKQAEKVVPEVKEGNKRKEKVKKYGLIAEPMPIPQQAPKVTPPEIVP